MIIIKKVIEGVVFNDCFMNSRRQLTDIIDGKTTFLAT